MRPSGVHARGATFRPRRTYQPTTCPRCGERIRWVSSSFSLLPLARSESGRYLIERSPLDSRKWYARELSQAQVLAALDRDSDAELWAVHDWTSCGGVA